MHRQKSWVFLTPFIRRIQLIFKKRLPVKIAHCLLLTISFSVKEITNPSSDAQRIVVEKSETMIKNWSIFLPIAVVTSFMVSQQVQGNDYLLATIVILSNFWNFFVFTFDISIKYLDELMMNHNQQLFWMPSYE